MKLTALLYRDIAAYKKLVAEFVIQRVWALGQIRTQMRRSREPESKLEKRKTTSDSKSEKQLIFLQLKRRKPYAKKWKTANRKGSQNRKSDVFQCLHAKRSKFENNRRIRSKLPSANLQVTCAPVPCSLAPQNPSQLHNNRSLINKHC